MAVSQHIQTDPRGRSDRLQRTEPVDRSWLPADPVPLGLSGFAITTAALSWIVLLLVVPAYALIGIGTGAGDSTIVHIGGGFGLACAAAAAYTAFAHVFNQTFEREALPLGDRSPS